MAESMNMSLDEIIKQSKKKRSSPSRRREGVNVRGHGGTARGVSGRAMANNNGQHQTRGRNRARGRGNVVQALSRSGTPGTGLARSRSRCFGGRAQSRVHWQSRNRSRFQNRQSNARLASKDGIHSQSLRPNSNLNFHGGVHSRLGIPTHRGTSNLRKSLAVHERENSKRGIVLTTSHHTLMRSAVGLKSDEILRERHNNMSPVKSQTITRSRHSLGSPSQLTISVANDFARRRHNSVESDRGGNRDLARNFVNNQVLNEQLQNEKVAIQGRDYCNRNPSEPPTANNKTLHQRFATLRKT